MSFYSTYDLTDLVRDDGIKTFNAREIATGRSVLVHLFTRPESLEMQALLKKVAKLPAEARAQDSAAGRSRGHTLCSDGSDHSVSGFPGMAHESEERCRSERRGSNRSSSLVRNLRCLRLPARTILLPHSSRNPRRRNRPQRRTVVLQGGDAGLPASDRNVRPTKKPAMQAQPAADFARRFNRRRNRARKRPPSRA